MKLEDILNNTITNHNLESLIDDYYSLDNYSFNNELEIDNLIDKFDIYNKEFSILDKEYLLNNFLENTENYLKHDNGLILFDLSMSNDNNLYKSIELLSNNYKNVNIHRLNDNYILDFDTKQINNYANIENSFKNLFTIDLDNLSIQRQIKNIPLHINNEQFYLKIKDDLNYLTLIQNQQYTNITNYKNNLLLHLNSEDYKVSYVFNDDVQYINKELYNNLFNQLRDYNNYIDDITIKLNKTTKNNSNIDDFFNIDKLNELYNKNPNYLNLKMNDVLDYNINIHKLDTIIDNDKYFNNVFKFLNELIKKKIIKVIKLNNFTNL